MIDDLLYLGVFIVGLCAALCLSEGVFRLAQYGFFGKWLKKKIDEMD